VWLAAGTVAVLIALSAVAALLFPKGAKVPMQWGINGNPTWTAPVGIAVAFTPMIAAVVFAVTLGLSYGKAQSPIDRILALQVVVFVLAHIGHLYFALRHFRSRS
jgi:hypothetical protein